MQLSNFLSSRNRLEFIEQALFKAQMFSGIQNFIHDSENDLPFPVKV